MAVQRIGYWVLYGVPGLNLFSIVSKGLQIRRSKICAVVVYIQFKRVESNPMNAIFCKHSCAFWRLILAMIPFLSCSAPVVLLSEPINWTATRVATLVPSFLPSTALYKSRQVKLSSLLPLPNNTIRSLITSSSPHRPHAMAVTRATSKRAATQESLNPSPETRQPRANKLVPQKKSQASPKPQTKPNSKPGAASQPPSEAAPVAPQPATRGRKRKADPAQSQPQTDETTRPVRDNKACIIEEAPATPSKIGAGLASSRKRSAMATAKQLDSSNKADETVTKNANEKEGATTEALQYFLIKSEPESRMQNGHDMKFSIDDLIAEDQSTAHWDGVRNHEARNVIKEMRIGDRAFFYHSNSRKVRPSIVGEVEIVKEAYPGTFSTTSKQF